MANSLQTNQTTSQNTTENYMLFSYWIIIVIFLGLVGNISALVIFSKVPLKTRSTSIHYKAISCSSLLSTIGYTLSYINSTNNSTQDDVMAYFCRLAVFLEVSGYVTYAIILTVLQCYSLLKTFHFVKQISVFASPKAAKLRIAAQCCIWTIGFALGFGLAWGVEDSVTSENRKSCELKWASGGVTWYRVMLTVAWMHVPGVISFIAIIATQRVRNWVLANNAVNSPTSFAVQVQNNALNKTLAGYFFISVILYHTIALIAATTQPSFLNSTPILVIKLLSQNHVVYGPFIFVFKSRSYRGHVGRILTCGSGEVSPSPASATGNNSSSMPAGRSTGSTTSRSGHRRTAVVPANPAGRPS